MAIRVYIYDDNSSRRESLKALVEMCDNMLYIGSSVNCENVESDMETYYPDVVLMDLHMPTADGIYGLKTIKKCSPEVKVLIQTVFDD